MAGFTFRLQSVLDYRTGLVDRARMELAALQARVADAEATLGTLQNAEQVALRELGLSQGATTLDLSQITLLLEYSEVLTDRIQQQRQVVEQRRQDADVQHQVMIGLLKDAKAIEKLRERQEEEYQQEDHRRDLAEMSEVASVRHQRAQASPA